MQCYQHVTYNIICFLLIFSHIFRMVVKYIVFVTLLFPEVTSVDVMFINRFHCLEDVSWRHVRIGKNLTAHSNY
jgi:hypothetical protein